jgi:hypothetical protein
MPSRWIVRVAGNFSWADFATNLTGFRTRVKFGASAGHSGAMKSVVELILSHSHRSRLAGKLRPSRGPIVINEIMYNPLNGLAGATEFIELHNITGPRLIYLTRCAPRTFGGWRMP